MDGKKKAEFFYIEKEPISDNILYKLIEHLQELYPELKIDLIDFNIECKLTLYDKIYGVYITIDWE